MHSIAIYIFILMRLLMDNYHLTKRHGHQECNNQTVFPQSHCGFTCMPCSCTPLPCTQKHQQYFGFKTYRVT